MDPGLDHLVFLDHSMGRVPRRYTACSTVGGLATVLLTLAPRHTTDFVFFEGANMSVSHHSQQSLRDQGILRSQTPQAGTE